MPTLIPLRTDGKKSIVPEDSNSGEVSPKRNLLGAGTPSPRSQSSRRLQPTVEAEEASGRMFREEAEKLESGEPSDDSKMKDLQTDISKVPCLIDPDSTRMRNWDIYIMLLLVFTAAVTPYEVAFMETKINFLFFVNRLIDLSFLGDMGLQFVLPFKPSSSGLGMQHFWVVSHKKIAWKYLTGWFLIDLISIFPFDSMGFFLEGVGNLKVLRIMRCARLIKLIRILKASALVQKLKRRMGLKYSTIKLIQFGVVIAVVVHWLSCMWMLVPRIDGGSKNWIGKYYFPELQGDGDGDGAESSVPTPQFNDVVTHDLDAGQLYLTCLYWSIMTLTTIGYGDVTAATEAEMFIACVGMALGASVYAYIVGGICGILANRDPVTLEFNQTLDNLNNLMLEYKIPRHMKENLREFHFKTQSLFRARMHQTVLEILSPELRNQIVAFINYKWISKVRLFKQLPPHERGAFMTKVTMAMTAQAYGPSEYIVRLADMMETMYIIKEGVSVKILASGAQKMLMNGDVAGSDITVRTAGFRSNFQLKTITFVITQELDREDLQQILTHPGFRETAKCLRRTAIKRLFSDCFLAYCRLFQSMHGLQTLSGIQMDPAGRKKMHEATGKMLRKHEVGELDLPDEDEDEDHTAKWIDEDEEDLDKPLTKREMRKMLLEQQRHLSESLRKDQSNLLKKLSHRLQAGLATIKKRS